MNKDLKAAIDKGQAEKADLERREREAQEAKSLEHQNYIQSKLPEARKYIQNVIFPQIAKVEAERYSYQSRKIWLKDYENGIPAEAIYEAAKEIEGLQPWMEHGSIYENGEFVGIGEPSYEIRWKDDKEESK